MNSNLIGWERNEIKARKNIIENSSTIEVYRTLRQWIVQKKLSPESKINQSKISEELNVSRTPVVKALHKLETEGLVDNIPNRGFYVHQLTIKELLELFAFREALETIIVTDIVDKISTEQIKELEEIFKPFNNADWALEATVESYWTADQRFHNFLLDLCENDFVKRINDNFQILNRTYIGGLIRKPAETLKEHQAIIEALRSYDREYTCQVAVEHISKTKELLQGIVNKLVSLGVNPAKIPVQDLPVDIEKI